MTTTTYYYYIEYEREDGTWARDGASATYDTEDDAQAALAEIVESGETDGAFAFRVTCRG
jgi:hypothetical protein